MSDLRIFSYLPNPRIWKATIAARLCGVDVEVRGAAPGELEHWLWDFDARPLSPTEQEGSKDLQHVGKTGFSSRLYKTEAFLRTHPFGTVPAAFSPEGGVGIFESNSIMRTVARLGEKNFPLYGHDAYQASRIDSFLDASLVFARDVQVYILALRGGTITAQVHAAARQAFTTYMTGIERALSSNENFITGGELSLADICFAAEFALFHNELAGGELLKSQGLTPILSDRSDAEFQLARTHFSKLRAHPAFAPDVEPYLQAFGTASL